jgi:hypothetical protein
MWFSSYHHSLHNLTFGLIVAMACFALADQKWKTGLLALLSFHFHLLEDVLWALVGLTDTNAQSHILLLSLPQFS